MMKEVLKEFIGRIIDVESIGTTNALVRLLSVADDHLVVERPGSEVDWAEPRGTIFLLPLTHVVAVVVRPADWKPPTQE